MTANPDTNKQWSRPVRTVRLEDDYTRAIEVIKARIASDGVLGQKAKDQLASGTIGRELQETVPKYMSAPAFSDTSVGGNDAMNPYWAYNEDDDIIFPLDDLSGGRGKEGLGGVYKEVYEQNQHVLWISCGVPVYTSIGSFYRNAVDSNLTDVQVNPNTSVMHKLAVFLGDGLSFALKLPWFPMIWGWDALKWIFTKEAYGVNEYYNFQSRQVLYYRTVNTMLQHLATSMGLMLSKEDLDDKKKGTIKVGGSVYNAMDSVPTVLKEGPDIFAMMDKRAHRLESKNKNGRSRFNTDKLLKEMQKNNPVKQSDKKASASEQEKNFWQKYIGGVKTSALNGADYVGFRIEKGTDSSESLTNSVGESSIGGAIKAKLDAARDARFSRGTLKTGIGFLDDIGNAMKKFAMSATNTITFGTFATLLESVAGNVAINIPETWKDSSFNKNYSFSMTLKSRYGDPVSIFQSIYIPLTMLMAMGLPRATGRNSYTSPFLLRCYCKGMFAIPFGIMESLSIQRGASEFGWNYHNLPTTVHVSFSIKDLSPVLFTTVADESFMDIFRSNTGLLEYLDTLSGLGLYERLYKMELFKRRFKAYAAIRWKNTFNPIRWGMETGTSNVVRYMAAVKRVGYAPMN